MKPVACIDCQSETITIFGRDPDTFEFTALLVTFSIGITAGMQLDDRRANRYGRIELQRIRIDKQGHADTGVSQARASVTHCIDLAVDVEASLGRELFTFLRNETDIGRRDIRGDAQHFIGHSDFEVHMGVHYRVDRNDIAILNMATILAQVDRNTVGAGLFNYRGRFRGTWVWRAPRLPQGCDMVDIDPKLQWFRDFQLTCLAFGIRDSSAMQVNEHLATLELLATEMKGNKRAQQSVRGAQNIGLIEVKLADGQQLGP